jgi:hypothetical protein
MKIENHAVDAELVISGTDGHPGVPKAVRINGVEFSAIASAQVSAIPGEPLKLIVEFFANSIKVERSGSA